MMAKGMILINHLLFSGVDNLKIVTKPGHYFYGSHLYMNPEEHSKGGFNHSESKIC